MKLKLLYIFLISISFNFYGQSDLIEIKGNIVDDEDTLKHVPALRVMLIFNDTLAIETSPDSIGNYSFKISRNFIKLYKIHLTAFQDNKTLKKIFPPDKECPYFNNYYGHLQFRRKLELNSDSSLFILNFKMSQVKAELRFPYFTFKKNSTAFSKCGSDDPDTSMLCMKKVLKENPTIIVELQVHSWNEQNMEKLSKNRAQMIINNLTEFGIDSERIKTTIWLDKKPLIKPDIINKAKTTEDKEKYECRNRRIVYRIVSWDYK
ncbi:MAG: hypothetical protein U0W65_10575 [Bacteroidia bacterium]